MFFLGIAGPLMPYLLTMGILIAFMLEVSTEELRKSEKISSNQNCLCMTGETEIKDEGCYYFHTQYHPPGQQDITANKNHFLSYFQPPGMYAERKVVFRSDALPADKYYGSCFGLSPPCKFVF